jgi:hypothetical protein
MTLASAKSKVQKEVVFPIHVIMLYMSPSRVPTFVCHV